MNRNRAIRLAQQRQANAPAKPDAKAQVARINDIIATSRGIWFGLLSYLAFVGVTWMGVKDADFFIPERSTQLPLIGVSVPTLLFFAIAPTIGALIYAYFHMQLLKLWEALTRTDPKIDGTYLSDHIKPWLVADLCLSYRKGALRPRPLAWISNKLNFLIVFWGTPFVLWALWLSSAAPHYEWLTILCCGLPLTFTTLVGINGWHRLKHLAQGGDPAKIKLPTMQRMAVIAIAFAVLVWGWLQVEGTFKNYAQLVWTEKQTEGTFIDWEILTFLKSADLPNVNFAKVPEGWPDRGSFRIDHRETWCKTVGIPAIACGPAPPLDKVDLRSTENEKLHRLRWCKTLFESDSFEKRCAAMFTDYEKDFEASWLRQRNLNIDALPKFDFRGANLRNANLSGAQLQGADLSEANLQQALLYETQLERASLPKAQLQSADLTDVQLQGADLKETQLQGAILIRSQLDEANLMEARMQGAFLGGTKVNSLTTLIMVDFRGAALKEVDLTGVLLSPSRLSNTFGDTSISDAFGDTSVTLLAGETGNAGSASWPKDWSKDNLDLDTFFKEWRAWQKTLPEGWDKDVPKP